MRPINTLLQRRQTEEECTPSESWPVKHFCGPVMEAELHPGVPWFSEGLGRAFVLSTHSPRKSQHYLMNLVSERSGNLTALYNLVNDIF